MTVKELNFLTNPERQAKASTEQVSSSLCPETKMFIMTRVWVLIQIFLSAWTSSEKKHPSFLKQNKLSKNFHHDHRPYPKAQPERTSRSLSLDHTALEQKNPGKSLQGLRLNDAFPLLSWKAPKQAIRQPCRAALKMDSNW